MPSGRYAVLQFTPDPARDELINVGIVISGPAGALFETDSVALDHMMQVEPSLDPDTAKDIHEFMTSLVARPAVQVATDGVTRIAPHTPEFLDAIRDQLPLRFTLGRSLFVELADTNREAMEATAQELLARLVLPVPSVAPHVISAP